MTDSQKSKFGIIIVFIILTVSTGWLWISIYNTIKESKNNLSKTKYDLEREVNILSNARYLGRNLTHDELRNIDQSSGTNFSAFAPQQANIGSYIEQNSERTNLCNEKACSADKINAYLNFQLDKEQKTSTWELFPEIKTLFATFFVILITGFFGKLSSNFADVIFNKYRKRST